MPGSASLGRRDLLLAAAEELIAERGYRGVGVDEIAARAGITGPGLYRHFPAKGALLAALCEQAIEGMLAGAGRRVAAAGDDSAAALRGLADLHARFAVSQRALLAVWLREQRELPPERRRALRGRLASYEALWAQVAGRRYPQARPDQVAVAVSAAIGLLNSTPARRTDLCEAEHVELLGAMALASFAALAPGA